MAAFFLRRAGFLFLVIIAVSIVTFGISHVAPGDPARMIAGPRATQRQVDSIRAELGLDRPLPIQYAHYVSHLVRGDLGTSIVTGRPVLEELSVRIPATLELMSLALLVSIAIGIPTGVLAALNRGRFLDGLIRSVSVASISIPSFWLAPVLIIVFYGD